MKLIAEFKKCFKVLGYMGPRKVDLVEFVLKGRAQIWYNNM